MRHFKINFSEQCHWQYRNAQKEAIAEKSVYRLWICGTISFFPPILLKLKFDKFENQSSTTSLPLKITISSKFNFLINHLIVNKAWSKFNVKSNVTLCWVSNTLSCNRSQSIFISIMNNFLSPPSQRSASWSSDNHHIICQGHVAF